MAGLAYAGRAGYYYVGLGSGHVRVRACSCGII